MFKGVLYVDICDECVLFTIWKMCRLHGVEVLLNNNVVENVRGQCFVGVCVWD